ncbi:MAG: hypothetical protein AAB911_01020 [Patescibacteria group bacterium]
MFKSEYISPKYGPLPKGWSEHEFWWAVEQLEKFGNIYNLFDLANSLGVCYDEKFRGKVLIEYLILNIIDEGGPKDKVLEAIKRFSENNNKE